ncbi:MAG: hypothetical protein ACREOO_15065 [bacterium]
MPKLDPVAHDATVSTKGNYLYSTEERGGLNDSETHPVATTARIFEDLGFSSVNAPPDGNGLRYLIKRDL